MIEDDSEDERELAKMFGIKPESRLLKDIKKEMKEKEQVKEPSSESEAEEVANESKPFKASQVISIDDLRLNKEDNIILVLGSEGEGVSRSINRLADYRVMIPP